ncbi:hypothetical protein vBRpoSV10_148 [Ruegeria phage vB_RpoS-V10]|nr:hypothetical protein vBRpoSV10_148 [Ruegeria phage vB_RpoS-V10]
MIHKFTIHSNGDNAEGMKARFLAVHAAANALEQALSQAAPNMRNYYVNPHGDDDFKHDVEGIRELFKSARAAQDWGMNGAVRAMEHGGK